MGKLEEYAVSRQVYDLVDFCAYLSQVMSFTTEGPLRTFCFEDMPSGKSRRRPIVSVHTEFFN